MKFECASSLTAWRDNYASDLYTFCIVCLIVTKSQIIVHNKRVAIKKNEDSFFQMLVSAVGVDGQ